MIMEYLLYPIATEKAVNMIERDNMITYVVDMRATKPKIKEEFEEEFKVKVRKIGILRSTRNLKKAFITIDRAWKASDIALKLKLI